MSVLLTSTRSTYRFSMPTRVHFGCGIISNLPNYIKELNMKSPLLVTDKTLGKMVSFKEALGSLQENEIEAKLWDGVVPDPTDTSISEGKRKYEEEECDGLVAFGGGSSMDSAKAIGVLVYNGGEDVTEYMGFDRKPIIGIPPLLCIPTTAGTGSEATNIAVVTHTSTNRKRALVHSVLYPKISVVDPDLTVTMPAKVTASTGMDALSHAIGCYTSPRGGNPISDTLALYATELISQNLRTAVYNGQEITARTNMSLAALMAGMAFTNEGVHLEHALGHMLGAKYHIPHGIGCVLLLPEILEFILPTRMERLAKIAQMFGVNTGVHTTRRAAEMAIKAISQLMIDVGIPSLAEATGATTEDVPELVELALKVSRYGLRPVTADDLAHMFRRAFARS